MHHHFEKLDWTNHFYRVYISIWKQRLWFIFYFIFASAHFIHRLFARVSVCMCLFAFFCCWLFFFVYIYFVSFSRKLFRLRIRHLILRNLTEQKKKQQNKIYICIYTCFPYIEILELYFTRVCIHTHLIRWRWGKVSFLQERGARIEWNEK